MKNAAQVIAHLVRNPYRPRKNMSGGNEIVQSALSEIGLSPNEITLYQAALSLGPKPASILAKNLKIQRTRVYDLLSSLESRGLIETIERNKVKYFSASSPDRILTLLKTRKEQVEKRFRSFESAIPSLFETFKSTPNGFGVQHYRGLRPVREILDWLLEDTPEYLLSIGDVEQCLRSDPIMNRWSQQFRCRRISKNIPLKIAIPGPPDFFEEEMLLRQTLSNPDIPADHLTIIGNDQMIILSLLGTPQATKIECASFCSVVRSLYSAWLAAVERIS